MDERPTSGEDGLLARMLPHLATSGCVEVGPGDDAAVLAPGGPRLVATTDTLVEGYDFLPGTTRPTWVGHKAAVQNLADVAAMGARPLALLSALSAPAHTPPDVFEGITAGLAARAEADGAVVVGGDLGRADSITVTVTALGVLSAQERPILRSGARPGDVLAIGAERLGRSAAGLALVLAGRVEKAGAVVRGAQDHADLVRHHGAPVVDLSLGWGGGRGASAMLDLSDGLIRDGGRLARASRVMLELDRSALAEDAEQLRDLAEMLDADPWAWILHGGEEHAMLATFPPSSVPSGFRPIGRARALAEGEAPDVLLDGAAAPGTGFDHFDPGP